MLLCLGPLLHVSFSCSLEPLNKVQILLKRFQEAQLYIFKLSDNANILSYKLILPFQCFASSALRIYQILLKYFR